MRPDGRVLAEAVNAVVRDGVTVDTTAHVERQLIDWYFARNRGLNERIEDLVVVTSLDPCAMCAGAILLSGMKSVALASDPMSGVHEGGLPHRMPRELWHEAESRMGFFGVHGREGQADHVTAVLGGSVSPTTLCEAEEAFETSLSSVRGTIGGSEFGGAHQGSRDATAVSMSTLAALGRLADELPEGACVPAAVINAGHPQSHQQLQSLLVRDASVLVNSEGTVLLGAPGREDISPARTSVLELVRAYISLQRMAWERLGICLPHPRRCSIIKQRAPTDPAKALMELGAIGSFCELERPNSAFPALGYLEAVGEEKIQRFVKSLPPLYTSVIKLDVGQVYALAS
jgi:tRNA(Arg) A34 adenosine deaminase TadA